MQWCWVYTTSVFSHWRGHRSGPYYYDITILRIRNNIQSNSLYILRLSFFFSNMCTPFWTLSYLSFILQLWPLNTSYTRLSMFQLARLGGTVGRLPQVPSEGLWRCFSTCACSQPPSTVKYKKEKISDADYRQNLIILRGMYSLPKERVTIWQKQCIGASHATIWCVQYAWYSMYNVHGVPMAQCNVHLMGNRGRQYSWRQCSQVTASLPIRAGSETSVREWTSENNEQHFPRYRSRTCSSHLVLSEYCNIECWMLNVGRWMLQSRLSSEPQITEPWQWRSFALSHLCVAFEDVYVLL